MFYLLEFISIVKTAGILRIKKEMFCGNIVNKEKAESRLPVLLIFNYKKPSCHQTSNIANEAVYLFLATIAFKCLP